MNRDYAKRKISHKKPQKNYLLLWLSILLLFIMFVSGLIMMNKYYYPKQILAEKASKPEKTISITKTISEPKFTFYSTLSSPKKPDQQAKISEDAYELEIATVDNFVAADRLKAELALLGFAANITPMYKQGVQKYYISIGPYDNQENADLDAKKLQMNRIKSNLKKVS